jgi:solute carrier family 25 carnitine/acylcarnitine transporter 20/29
MRALVGEPARGVWGTFRRLLVGEHGFLISKFHRPIHLVPLGPDPKAPRPLLSGFARLYRGLSVSAIRSITTHGLLWTFFDIVANYIDHLPPPAQHA